MNSNLQAILARDKSEIEQAVQIAESDWLAERLRAYVKAVEKLEVMVGHLLDFAKDDPRAINNLEERVQGDLNGIAALLSGKEGE